ncbi:AraC family transcriptional regulator [Rahnella bruchi]|uniref:helix-turn-helix domain-containing protein n=1 Tax=Rahnella bruchi TaxID=1510573 RepID=UPI000EA10E5D|nr:AraC family transcriptional regulator [Rahnella bruchi]
MYSVPFPVITLFALLILITMALLPEKNRHSGTLRFLIACTVLLSVGMLRWEYESVMLRNIQSVLAILLPPLAWHSFISMTDINKQRRWLLLLLPPAIALLIRMFWPVATDFILFIIFTGYGCDLLRIAWIGERNFTLSRLAESTYPAKMAFFAGCFLCISALTDLAVTFDFRITGGKQAAGMIVIFQMTLLPLIAAAIVSAGRTTVSGKENREEMRPVSVAVPVGEFQGIYCRLEKHVRETQIYLNPDLTLSILARKTGIPARHLSGAVNSVSQCNVSQWINGFRIERAKELLLSTLLPVTDIMLESGFTTKSNFNREFLRVSGVSPTLFRQQVQSNQAKNSGMH